MNMGNVVQINQVRRDAMGAEPAAIIKIIDGKPVEYVDVDRLSSLDRERYFAGRYVDTPHSKPRGASLSAIKPLS
jgi:hypothetical protein